MILIFEAHSLLSMRWGLATWRIWRAARLRGRRAGRTRLPASAFRGSTSQLVHSKSFGRSQLPHKFVNSSITITNITNSGRAAGARAARDYLLPDQQVMGLSGFRVYRGYDASFGFGVRAEGDVGFSSGIQLQGCMCRFETRDAVIARAAQRGQGRGFRVTGFRVEGTFFF